MRAGKLRHLIQLQSSTPTEDGAGGRTLVWATYASVYADRKPVPAVHIAEPTVAEKPQPFNLYDFEIRYRTDVSAAHRILYEGIALNIRSIVPGERRDHIVLRAEAGVAL